MKKLFTLFCAAALATAAQAEVKLWLESITPKEGFEDKYYKYNENGLVRQLIDDNFSRPDLSFYSMYDYDDAGNLIRVSEFQDVLEEFDMNKYLPVNYVEYKYNNLGQRTERINYNNWHAKEHPDQPNFLMGAVMLYEYNLAGEIEKVITYWDQNLTKLHEVDQYFYNDKGLLIKREISHTDFSGKLIHESNVNYTYDADDQLIQVQQCQFDEATNKENTEYFLVYTYDAEGNLTKQEKKSASGVTVMQKYEYFYKDASFEYNVKEVAYPIDPEDAREASLYKGLKHVLDYCVEYDTDINTGQLMPYDTYTYNYTDDYDKVRPGVKMVDVARPESAGLTFAGVSGNRLMLRGINVMDNVRIYDMEGRLMMSDTYSTSGLDVTNLPAGAYVVSTSNGSAKFVK